MGSKSFPSVNEQLVRLLAETGSSFDIAGRYAKHRGKSGRTGVNICFFTCKVRNFLLLQKPIVIFTLYT